MEEISVGNVCVCQKKVVGIIKSIVEKNGVKLYKGVSLKGKPWQSKKPRLLAKDLDEYNRNERLEMNIID